MKKHSPLCAGYGELREAQLNRIHPDGWLRQWMERQRDGLGLHHAESGYPFNTCLWADKIPKRKDKGGEAWWPYEQTAYLVDGLTRTAILLGGVTLLQSPLVFSPLIKESDAPLTSGFKCSAAFPAHNLSPASPWNYAVNTNAPVKSVRNKRRIGAAAFPWAPDAVPLMLRVKCHAVPSWAAERHTPSLPPADAKRSPKEVTITFIPSGATRLRLDVLPTF